MLCNKSNCKYAVQNFCLYCLFICIVTKLFAWPHTMWNKDRQVLASITSVYRPGSLLNTLFSDLHIQAVLLLSTNCVYVVTVWDQGLVEHVTFCAKVVKCNVIYTCQSFWLHSCHSLMEENASLQPNDLCLSTISLLCSLTDIFEQ